VEILWGPINSEAPLGRTRCGEIKKADIGLVKSLARESNFHAYNR
jgi:hypothetical protein